MMPSPVYWLTVPSKRCTPSVRISKKRSRMRCHSSAPSCSASSIEPLTSANKTVTCLRSPSSADFDCRILSARFFGVEERGSVREEGRAGSAAGAAPATAAPQPSQKRAPTRSATPQLVQATASGAPHASQKRASARFSCAQPAQITGRSLPRPAQRATRRRSRDAGAPRRAARARSRTRRRGVALARRALLR